MINEANPSEKALLLKSYGALGEVARGQATKLVIPSDLQSIAGLTTIIKEIANGQ